jgi:alanine transaminase
MWTSHCIALMFLWKPVSTLNHQLLAKASVLRERLPKSLASADELFFPSAYSYTTTQDPCNLRGFCNWILPGRIMVGQYPGQVPEVPGPSESEVQNHLSAVLLDAGVTCFVCLQSELPCQNDWDAWAEFDGQVYLYPHSRRNFPRPFVQYAPIAERILQSQAGNATPITGTYLHWPIEDLSTPQNSISELLGMLLTKLLEHDKSCLYIHCWGGRGRAGLTAACLLSLIYPTMDAAMILDHVQQGYDSRSGADQMPFGLRQSPQTQTQRQFVRDFVRQRQAM